MSNTSLTVLAMLASGRTLSGEHLGQTMGISRMAISKAIKNLKQRGLNIHAVPGKGYQLELPVQLLDKKAICSALNETDPAFCQIEVFQQIESTSDYLLQQSGLKDIHRAVCLTECQDRGRGRRQREWLTTPYRNIMLSIGWRFDEGMAGLSSLGIAAGIIIVKTLHEAGFDKGIGLKWPNDIVWKDKKLGGLLIDVRGEADGPCVAVLGLGLNLALSDEVYRSIDQPCVSLAQISNNVIDRNSLVISLIRELMELFNGYSSSGFEYFQQLWPDYDRIYGREVNVTRGNNLFSGKAMGIDAHGALLLDEGKEPFNKFMSGDVSLRLAR